MNFKSYIDNNERLKDFSATAFCFIVVMLFTKIFDIITFASFMTSLLHSLVTSSFIVLLTFVIYLITSLISKKFANIIISLIFGILVVSEIGLTIYAHESGQLMGAELFIRPLSEIMQTVFAAMNVFVVIILIVATIGGFSLLAYFARQRIKASYLSVMILVLMFTSIPAVFFIDDILDKSGDIEARNSETSKIWYMILSNLTMEDVSVETVISYDEAMIDKYLSENPDYIIPDKRYPLERIDNTSDVLGKYFDDSEIKPDVVIILVESLGSEMMGSDGLAPFIDSLAQKSLYWKNCLSTTTRSYGAVPAVTSSSMGPKGFQFGIMPEHNSLFSIMKSNGYKTNAFYGGDFSFDAISEYLIAQDIDYMSDLYEEYKSGDDKSLGNWWGYFDHVMFSRSIEEIKKMKSPMFNLIVTITNHEALDLKDEKTLNEYLTRTDEIISKMDKEKASVYAKNKMRFSTMLYTDDCVRDFMNQYKELPNYENTIFVITGDHSSGLIIKNKLSYHTVPLIIWSPMLKETKTFNSIVTHNDIAPSLNALLRDKYNLETPEYVHWISDGLDTSSQMNFNKRMIHVNYNREMREIVYDKYMYWTKNQWEAELVNEIDDNLNMSIIYNDSLMSLLNSKLELYKYIIRYTYHNNKLTQYPINSGDDYRVYETFNEKKKIVCVTPDKKPSEVGNKTFKIFDDVVIGDNIDRIKITLDADIFINDSLWQDEYMDLIFECREIDSDVKKIYIDKVGKFVTSDVLRNDRWYDMNVSKEFVVSSGKQHVISTYLSSVRYDNEWVGGSTLTIGERNATIEVR